MGAGAKEVEKAEERTQDGDGDEDAEGRGESFGSRLPTFDGHGGDKTVLADGVPLEWGKEGVESIGVMEHEINGCGEAEQAAGNEKSFRAAIARRFRKNSGQFPNSGTPSRECEREFHGN